MKKYHDPDFGEITQPVSSDPSTHVKLDAVAGIYKTSAGSGKTGGSAELAGQCTPAHGACLYNQ